MWVYLTIVNMGMYQYRQRPGRPIGGFTMTNTNLFQREYERINSLPLAQDEKDARLQATLKGFKGDCIEITEQHVVIKFLDMLKKESVKIYSAVISGKADDCIIESKRLDLGVLTRGCNVINDFEIITAKGTAKVNGFTKDFVTITSSKDEIDNMAEVGKYNDRCDTCHGLKIKHDGANTTILLPRIGANDKVYYIDWKTKKVIKKISKKHTSYMFLASSASGDRNNRAVFFRCENIDDIKDLLTRRSLGAYGIMLKKYTSLSIDECIKATKDGSMTKSLGRIGQMLTGSINFGKLSNVARFTDDFTTKQVADILDENLNPTGEVIESQETTGDGKNWILCDEFARLVSNAFTNKFGIEIKVYPVACIGLQLQAGFGGNMGKGSTIVVDSSYMRHLWESVRNEYNWECYRTIFSKQEFYNTVPGFLFEGSTDKAEFIYEDIDFEYKNRAKKSNSETTTSGQIIGNIVERDFLDGENSTILEDTMADVMNNTLYYYRDKIDRVTELNVRVAGVDAFGDIPYADDMMVALDNSFRTWYAPSKFKYLKQMENAMLNTLNKQKYLLESPGASCRSSFTMMVTEDSKLCGDNPLLHIDELYNTGMSNEIESTREKVLKYLKELRSSGSIITTKEELTLEINKALEMMDSYVVYNPNAEKALQWTIPCVGFRYPNPGREHCLRGAKFVSFSLCILERSIGDNDSRVNTIKRLNDGSTMLSEDSNLMSMLEGADYDGDTILTIINKEITKALEYNKEDNKLHYEVVNNILKGL